MARCSKCIITSINGPVLRRQNEVAGLKVQENNAAFAITAKPSIPGMYMRVGR